MMFPLYLISTPLGNLEDITQRSLTLMKETRTWVAEHPELTQKLVQAYGLEPKRWLRYSRKHENDVRAMERILAHLEEEPLLLLSDAGAPGIADPGARLVSLAWEKGITVQAIPGPSAVICAVQLAGAYRAESFSFHGFLNRLQATELKSLAARPGPWAFVFLLSPHRGEKELEVLSEAFASSAQVTLCFELTKSFERVQRGTFTELKNTEIRWQGECTCVVETLETSGVPSEDDAKVMEFWRLYHERGDLTPRELSRKLAQLLGRSAQEVYQLGLTKKP